MTERLYTTRQAAAALDVSPNLIAQWKAAGKVAVADELTALGRGNRGGREPLYRLEDLQPLADAYHQRSATRRPTPP